MNKYVVEQPRYDLTKRGFALRGFFGTQNRLSQANLFEKWSKDNYLLNTSNDKLWNRFVIYFFHTFFFIYSMIAKYRNYLELEWQLIFLLPLLVAGWEWSSYTVQMNNLIGKWMIQQDH